MCPIDVAVTGDDSADGDTAPVKTLKHALELANADNARKTINLGAGTYDAANGESFPYTLPVGVKIVGEAGTILAGTTAQTGLIVDSGTLQNLEFHDFMTAVHITGTATLTTTTVATSRVGVLADGAANLTVTGLAVTGSDACTGVGLHALGTSQVTVNALVAANTLSIVEGDQAVVSIANGNITGNANCTLIDVAGKSLTLTDTQLSGPSGQQPPTGPAVAIHLGGASNGLDVTLSNTTIAGVTLIDANKGAITGSARAFHMTNGAIRNNAGLGAVFMGGSYTFTGVELMANSGRTAIYVGNDAEPAALAMRNCSITNNGSGVQVAKGARGDFGTILQPGNNTFQSNQGVGLLIDDDSSAVTAVGNIWRPNVQGADGDGKYSMQLVTGLVPKVDGNNFAVPGASTLQL